MTCPAGETPREGDRCEPAGSTAGTPPERCAEGFVADDSGGCVAQMVDQPCGPGLLAQLGETSCHEIAACGDGPWGDIDDDPSTEFVDPSFSGVADGSQSAPWSTIAEALGAAAPAAVVALAAGTYVEDVRIDGKPITLRGRCPSMVTIEGAGVQPASVSVVATDGVRIQGLSITGPRMGIWVLDSGAAEVHETRVHDVDSIGLAVRGPTSRLDARTLLVEGVQESGVLVEGATVDIERSTVRSTASRDDGGAGFGMMVQPDRDTGELGRLTVRSSVIEHNHGTGLASLGAHLEVVGTLIRDTLPDLAGDGAGLGVALDHDATAAAPGSLRIESSEVVRSVGHGVLVHGGDGVVDATSIRDVAPHPTVAKLGWGVALLDHQPLALGVSATITVSLIERAHGAGLYAMGGPVSIERTVVRDTQRLAELDHGRGIELDASPTGVSESQATVRDCLITTSSEVGLMAVGTDLTLESTAIRQTQPNQQEGAGFGLVIEHDQLTDTRAHATVRWCTVEDSTGAGLIVAGAEATIESTLVRRTVSRPWGTAGVGISVQQAFWSPAAAAATIRNCQIEDSQEMGIFAKGAQVTIEHTDVLATTANGEGIFGDCIGVILDPAFPELAQIRDSNIQHCERAGISIFGAQLQLGSTMLNCSPIHMNGEARQDFDFEVADLGGNWCGCGDVADTCVVLSSGLDPPDPVY